MVKYPIWRTYKMRHACFTCRKTFPGKSRTRQDQVICPQCGQPMHDMGINFKAPRQSDVKQWHKVERLHRAGFRFSGYTFFGKRPPCRLNQVEDYIEDHRPKAKGEQLLDQIDEKTGKRRKRP
jgi:DNA-directed RNA polymerase subunit RPC12/RpoP